jgi:hypothetical protein
MNSGILEPVLAKTDPTPSGVNLKMVLFPEFAT